MMDGPNPALAIAGLDQLNVLPLILPEVVNLKNISQTTPHVQDVWEHTLQTLHYLNDLLAVLKGNTSRPKERENNPRSQFFVQLLAKDHCSSY